MTLESIDDSKESLFNKKNISDPLRILFIKPYQSQSQSEKGMHLGYSPPLGLISIAATLRERFAEKIDVRMVDMKVLNEEPELIFNYLRDFNPHIVGVSALNCEMSAAHEISKNTKQYNKNTITVLGGPYSLHRAEEIFHKSTFDWIFNGAADLTFPEAVHCVITGEDLGNNIVGFNYRKEDNSLQLSPGQDSIQDLDALPLPAWDLIDFDMYAHTKNMAFMLKGKRYASLFTSRGCPYRCNYCHDLFTKKYVYQSPERVIEEIAYLYENYGVDEFQIIDDIFNLHKPRLKAIFREVIRRWPGQLKFNFPNGLRADILDTECIELMCKAGTYWCGIAIETVTPRLQKLVGKNLDIDKAGWAISEFNKYKCGITGFFMLGFPTETAEEIEATIDYILRSDITIAFIFQVNFQPGTPIFPLAEKENAKALEERLTDEGTYTVALSWYERAYGYPLQKMIRSANLKFFLHPKRIWRILERVPKKMLLKLFLQWLKLMLANNRTSELFRDEPQRAATDQAVKQTIEPAHKLKIKSSK